MTYLTLGTISRDQWMSDRVAASAAQEGVTDAGIDPDTWMGAWRRVWAAAPGWAAAWDSAVAAGIMEPGRDPAVITDGQIRAQVQAMKPFRLVGQPAAPATAHTTAGPSTITGEWSEILSLDIPAAGPWALSGTWTGTSISTSLEVRVSGGQPLRLEPKDPADRSIVSVTGWADGPTTLLVEARKTSLAGVTMIHAASAWWLAGQT